MTDAQMFELKAAARMAAIAKRAANSDKSEVRLAYRTDLRWSHDEVGGEISAKRLKRCRKDILRVIGENGQLRLCEIRQKLPRYSVKDVASSRDILLEYGDILQCGVKQSAFFSLAPQAKIARKKP